MMDMKTKNLLWMTLPLMFLVGCASNSREQALAYTPADTSALSPTSNTARSRIYSDSAPSTPVSASPGDVKLGQEVRQLLMEDRNLAPPPSNFTATAHDGVVTLCGTISTRHKKKELHDRIAQLPGVTRVDDQLETR